MKKNKPKQTQFKPKTKPFLTPQRTPKPKTNPIKPKQTQPPLSIYVYSFGKGKPQVSLQSQVSSSSFQNHFPGQLCGLQGRQGCNFQVFLGVYKLSVCGDAWFYVPPSEDSLNEDEVVDGGEADESVDNSR